MEMTFDFPPELEREIKKLPDANRFMINVVQKALVEKWQDEEVEKGIAEADAGELVSHEAVKKRLARYIK